jgi:hypothetical protein
MGGRMGGIQGAVFSYLELTYSCCKLSLLKIEGFWKENRTSEELVFKISLLPPCCKKKLQQFCLCHQNVLNFSAFGLFFVLDEAEKRREEGKAGGSG